MPVSTSGAVRVEGNATGAVLVSGSGNIVTVVYGANLLYQNVTTTEAVAPVARQNLGPNPYQGLDAFDETSSDLFFGRKSLTETLLGHLAKFAAPAASVGEQMRLLAVVGPSGSGKSSVARAGLVPALARTTLDWLRGAAVVVLRPGADPVGAISAALARLVTGDPAPIEKQGEFAREIRGEAKENGFAVLARVAAMRAGTGPLVVLVDQFEQTYTLCRPADPKNAAQAEMTRAERDAFVQTLLHAAAEPGGRVCIVVTIRSDFLGSLSEHPALSKAVAANHEIVPAMDREDLRCAVAEPAQMVGQPLDPDTVERILDEAEAGGGAAVLPLVQYTLFKVWEEMRGGEPASKALTALGGVGGAVAKRADTVMRSLPTDAARALAWRTFLAMVQPGEGVARDTRRRAWLDEVVPAGTTAEEAQRILKMFADERLLATGAAEDGRIWLELPHEALIRHWRALCERVEAQRQDLRFRIRLQGAVEAWKEKDRPRGSLWRGPDLDLLRGYAERNPGELAKSQDAFLTASERQARLVRCLAQAAAVAIVALAIVASVLAYMSEEQKQEADRLRTTAEQEARNSKAAQEQAIANESRALAALSVTASLEGNYTDALKLAIASWPRWAGERPMLAKSLHALSLATEGRTEAGASIRREKLVQSAAVSPDGKLAVTITAGRMARLWDAATGKPIGQPLSHEGLVTTVAFDRDGKQVLIAFEDGTARLWNTVTGASDLLPMRHNGRVLAAAFGAEGPLVVTVPEDRVARLWNAATGKPIGQPLRHEELVTAAAFDRDGTRVITVSRDRAARLWDTATGIQLGPRLRHKNLAQIAALSAYGGRVITISDDGTARLWSAAHNEPIGPALRHNDTKVLSTAFSTEGPRLVTAPDPTALIGTSANKTARLWDVASGVHVGQPMQHDGAVQSAAFSPDGKWVITTARPDRTARLWVAATGELIRQVHHDGQVLSAAFSPDGEWIVTACEEKTDDFTYRRTGRLWDRTVRLWNAATGEPIGHPLRHEELVTTAAISLGRKRVITVSLGRTARLWDAATGEPIGQPLRHDGVVNTAGFSPDGKWVVTASADRTARLWDAATGEPIGQLLRHEGAVNTAGFSPDGKWVVTASEDSTAQLWDAATGKPFGPPMIHDDKHRVRSADFSRDGTRILTVSERTPDPDTVTTRLWDAATAERLGPPMYHEAQVLYPAFDRDGTRVLTASPGRARLWDVGWPKGPITAVACALLIDRDVADVVERQGIVIRDPICDPVPPAPPFAWSDLR